MRLPYIRFYFRDYLGDTGHLTAQQDGIYIRLIANYCTTGRALPEDLPTLCRMARAITPSEQQDVAVVAHQFFQPDTDGLYHHKRIDAELEWSATRHARAAKGGYAKAAAARAQADDGSENGDGAPPPLPPTPPNPTPTTTPASQQKAESDAEAESDAVAYAQATAQAGAQAEPHENTSVGQAGMQAGGEGSGPSTPGAVPPDPPATMKNKTDQERWEFFINDTKGGLPDLMKYAIPRPETIPLVLERANAQKGGKCFTKAQALAMDISDWAESRCPPLDGLKSFRWEAWIKETQPES